MIDTIYKLLARIGYTDPLHPPIVHIPIGLVIGAFLLLAVAIIFKRKRLVLTARHFSIMALIFAFPAILFGVFDWIHFYQGELLPAIKIKMVLAGALLVLLGAGVIIGGEGKSHRVALSVIYFLSFALVVALGYFGASLVFGQAGSAAQGQGSTRVAKSSDIGVSQAPPASLQKGAEGAAIFQTNCASCHPGGANVIEAKLTIRGSKKLSSLDSFQAFVRAPTMPDGKAGAMPAFGAGVLSSDHVKELYDYVVKEFK